MAMVHIRGHMRRQKYKYIKQFFQDFLLMFQNAKTYNQEGSQIYDDASVLQTVLEQEIRKHFPDFDARAAITEWRQLDDEPASSGPASGPGASGASKRAAEGGALESEAKRAHAPVKLFHCPECGVGFSRQQNLRRHAQQFHSDSADGEAGRRGAAKDSPYPAAAQTVLDSQPTRQPLHYKEITRRAMEQGLIKPLGRTPENTMHGQMNKSDLFTAMGRGLFALAKWGMTPPPNTPRPGAGAVTASPGLPGAGSAVASPAPFAAGSTLPEGSSPPAVGGDGAGNSDLSSDEAEEVVRRVLSVRACFRACVWSI
jgi:hypothetical protein